jgi:hypothetical protein
VEPERVEALDDFLEYAEHCAYAYQSTGRDDLRCDDAARRAHTYPFPPRRHYPHSLPRASVCAGLAEAIGRLASVTELTHVVKMLRGATERFRASVPAAPAAGAPGRKAAARRKGAAADDSDEDGDEDGDGAAPPPPSSSSSGPAMSSSELLTVLREVVRMLTEYASILRSQLEDAQERGAWVWHAGCGKRARRSGVRGRTRARACDV